MLFRSNAFSISADIPYLRNDDVVIALTFCFRDTLGKQEAECCRIRPLVSQVNLVKLSFWWNISQGRGVVNRFHDSFSRLATELTNVLTKVLDTLYSFLYNNIYKKNRN